MATFAERLIEALRSKEMSAAELCRKADIPESVMSQYKKGLYEPKQRRLEKISTILNVSSQWLLGNDVPIDSAHPEVKTSSYEQQRKHEELIGIAERLTEKDIQKLIEYAEFLKSKHNQS